MIVRAATWRGRAGVTLVELLMTTAIMAVVAAWLWRRPEPRG